MTSSDNIIHITGAGGLVEDQRGDLHAPDESWGFVSGGVYSNEIWEIELGGPTKGDAPKVRMARVANKMLGFTVALYGMHTLQLTELVNGIKTGLDGFQHIKRFIMGHLQQRLGPDELYALLARIKRHGETVGYDKGRVEVRDQIKCALGL